MKKKVFTIFKTISNKSNKIVVTEDIYLIFLEGSFLISPPLSAGNSVNFEDSQSAEEVVSLH